jgi:alkylation response protein AidB-like acyl-CoA dehydrogenase
MDFRFDDDQLALRDAVRSFCSHQAGLGGIGARPPHASEALWTGLADLGVLGLLVPAERGGSGGSTVEAALVFEELGAHLVTGPVLWSTVAAPLVPDVAEGSVRVAGVVASVSEPGPVAIEHVAESDVVVVVHDDRVERCIVAARLGATGGEPLDPLTPAAVYPTVPEGEVIGGREEAQRVRLVGTVLAAAMLVGVAQGALDVASQYAKERHQFGVPIGSFQAVKHLLADAYVRAELARSATYAAAAIADDARAGDAAKAASTAKLLSGEAGIANGRTAVQVLGGMGFTWEMLPHYFLKRAWVLEHSFATGDAHALALSAELAAEVAG